MQSPVSWQVPKAQKQVQHVWGRLLSMRQRRPHHPGLQGRPIERGQTAPCGQRSEVPRGPAASFVLFHAYISQKTRAAGLSVEMHGLAREGNRFIC
eukprot:6177058-Pleurochrysis_carterae.AAC.2